MDPSTLPPLHVLVVGISTEPICGVRAYAEVLDLLLERSGARVTRAWIDVPPGGSAPLGSLVDEVAGIVARGDVDAILLHYSVFAFAHRGVPLGMPRFARRLGRMGMPVVVLGHELAYPWRRRGWRGATQALTQRLALLPLFKLSASVVVTTPGRRAWLESRWWLPSRRVDVAPVFSTIEPTADPGEVTPGRIGVFGFGAAGLDVQVTVDAVALASEHVPGIHLALIGAPGPGSAPAEEWLAVARQAGCTIEFTGVGTPAEVSRELDAAEVIVFPDIGGPSARKTSFAAVLRHARPTIAFPPQEPWPDLTSADAVCIVVRETVPLSAAIVDLVRDAERRAALGAAARVFSMQHLQPTVAAAVVGQALAEAQGR